MSAPDTPEAIAAQVNRYGDLERYVEAERIVRRGLLDYPEHVNLLNKLCWVLQEQGRSAEALAAADAALAHHPDEPALYFRRGRSLWDLGRGDEAVEAATRGLELDPHDALLLGLVDDRGLYLSQRGRYAEALTSFRLGLDRVPGDVDMLRGVGHCLSELGHFGEADGLLEAAVSADPHDAQAWYCLARNHMYLSRARASLAAFATAARLEPDAAWRIARVRNCLSWPATVGYRVLRWALPVSAVLAFAAVALPWAATALAWSVTALLGAAALYSVSWWFRGGTAAWRAVAAEPAATRATIAAGFVAAYAGAAAVVLGVWTVQVTPLVCGLAASVVLWLVLACDTDREPGYVRSGPRWRRLLSHAAWELHDDVTAHPARLWQAQRHRMGW